MTGKNAIREVIEFCHMVAGGYIADLTDADLMVRSVPGSNHIAWQLGHLISSDHQMLSALGHTVPPLPEGFAEAHGKEAAGSDNAAAFRTKNEYLTLAEQMKAAKLNAVEATADETLTQPGPEAMREYAPTIAAVLTLLGTHWLMHAGQFVPIRRKIGKPPLF
jgi:uncharacterized damage-inducible protein DinB